MKEFMDESYREALKAYKKGEVPVGCVIVYKNKIIARAHNLKERKKCSIYHAEIIAIKKASKKRKNWRLLDCVMYITKQPCDMCMSAIRQSRIKKIYIGDCTQMVNDINSDVVTSYNLPSAESQFLIKKFFRKKRNKTDCSI